MKFIPDVHSSVVVLCCLRCVMGKEGGWLEGRVDEFFCKRVDGKNAWPVNVRIIEGA